MQTSTISFLQNKFNRATWYRLGWGLRAAVTLVLAGYLMWRVRAELGTLQLYVASPLHLALALVSVVGGALLSTRLWHNLIPTNHRVPFLQLLAHYLQGFFWNNFIPSGLGGDAVRTLALQADLKHTDVALSSVLMARLAGLWSIVLLAAGAVLLEDQQPVPIRWLGLGAPLVVGGGTALLLSESMATLLRRLSSRLSRWHTSLRAYRDRPAQMLQALGWALAIQGCGIAVNALAAKALNLPITPDQLLLTLPFINLTALVPISLAGFGVREGAYAYFLGLFGVAASQAIILSLAVYALLTLVATAGVGLCLLIRSDR
jgi:uncharacterized membrane protein YbhN (UPF0104 family)